LFENANPISMESNNTVMVDREQDIVGFVEENGM
jgi:hypothetical protein